MITVRGRSDGCLREIRKALKKYEALHPEAKMDVYRHSSVSVRVRIIDPDFAGVDKGVRHNTVWDFFKTLSEDEQSQITLLLLLTPDELENSIANLEFENPIPSKL